MLLDYWPELTIPNSNGFLKNLDSAPTLFNTAQMDVDRFIKEELDQARINKRELSRKIQFGKSEKVLYDYTKDDHDAYELFKKQG